MSFTDEENGNIYSSPEAFHCWVETDNYFTDFTAPEYIEALVQGGVKANIKRMIFKKIYNPCLKVRTT
ncbi:DUF2026 family protein [Pseudomonas segetis]|uniref:DUF2026 family protein n=1 Tax=Pseudomonas segetis TaxID=298908 RepID=UPI00112FE4C8